MPRLPSLVLFALGSLAPLVAAAEPPAGEAQVYKRVAGRELKLHLVRPEGWKASDRRPGIVFFHGGGWVNGQPSQFNAHALYFASRGLVCIQAEYRLAERGAAPVTCIQDARSAMRWVRSHAAELGLDPRRIASAGGSAGGHLAAQVGMMDTFDDPQDDRAVSPKSNAMLLYNPVLDNGPGEFGAKSIGDRYREFSPAHAVSADDPPAIVFLGDADKLIPVATLARYRDAMRAAGVRCELHVYPGQPHGFFNARNKEHYLLTVRETDRFLASLGWLDGPPGL